MDEAIDVMRTALTLLAEGDVVHAAAQHAGAARRRSRHGPHALVPRRPARPSASRSIAAFPANFGSEYDTHQGVVLVFDTERGLLRAIVDATSITAIRTAAVSGRGHRPAGAARRRRPGHHRRRHPGPHPPAGHARRAARCAACASSACRPAAPRSSRRASRGCTACTVEACATRRRGRGRRRPHLHHDDRHRAGRARRAGSARAPTSTRWAPTRRPPASSTRRSSPKPRLYADRRESLLSEAGEFLIPKGEGLIGDDHVVGEIGELLQRQGRRAARRPSRSPCSSRSASRSKTFAAAHHVYSQRQGARPGHVGRDRRPALRQLRRRSLRRSARPDEGEGRVTSEARVPTRMGDGTFVRLTRSEIRADLEAGSEAAAKRAKVPPLEPTTSSTTCSTSTPRRRASPASTSATRSSCRCDGTGMKTHATRIQDLQYLRAVDGRRPARALRRRLLAQGRAHDPRLRGPVHARRPALPRWRRCSTASCPTWASTPSPTAPATTGTSCCRSAASTRRGAAQEEAVEMAVRRHGPSRRRAVIEAGADAHRLGHDRRLRRPRVPGRAARHRDHPREVPRHRRRARHGRRVRARHARRARVRRRAPGRPVAARAARCSPRRPAPPCSGRSSTSTPASRCAWNMARALTIVKPCMAGGDDPRAHPNAGMGVGGVPMFVHPPADAVCRAAKSCVDILRARRLVGGLGRPARHAQRHAQAAGMGGMRAAGDLVARMQMTRGMRLAEAKEYVAGKLGVSAVRPVRPGRHDRRAQRARLRPHPQLRDQPARGRPTRSRPSSTSPRVLDVPINCVERFKERTAPVAAGAR